MPSNFNRSTRYNDGFKINTIKLTEQGILKISKEFNNSIIDNIRIYSSLNYLSRVEFKKSVQKKVV